MTGAPLEDTQPGAGWTAESEFDWRHYVMVLAAWRREIAAITVAAALLAGLAVVALNWLIGPKYNAWADVAIVRTISELNFDERFTTTSGTDVRYIATNATARRNALLGLAQGPAIAEQVVGQLGEVLDAEKRIPANLAKDVKAALVSSSGRPGDSDLIRITATANTPDKAARIAAAWTETYVREVNQTYGQAPDELLDSMRAEQVKAQANYEQVQAALEEFIAGNRSDELNRKINEKQGIINQIATVRANVAAAYLNTETQTRTARFGRWLQVTRALDQARTLRGQVAAGGVASTGGGALVAELLKIQALTQVLDPSEMTGGGSSQGSAQVQLETPLQIQLNTSTALSQVALLTDIDALVKALEQRRDELEREIAAPGEELATIAQSVYLGQPASGEDASTTAAGSELLDSAVGSLEEQVRGLRARLETEGARAKELSQDRDLAWETLKTVNSKVTELTLARAAGGSEVRLAAAPVKPAGPESSGVVKAVVFGGMLGLALGIFIALAANAFGLAPFFSRRHTEA